MSAKFDLTSSRVLLFAVPFFLSGAFLVLILQANWLFRVAQLASKDDLKEQQIELDRERAHARSELFKAGEQIKQAAQDVEKAQELKKTAHQLVAEAQVQMESTNKRAELRIADEKKRRLNSTGAAERMRRKVAKLEEKLCAL